MRDTTPAGKRLLLLFWILANVPWSVHAQQDDLAFETILPNQGAPTSVQCILQDRTGYLWFATWSGLYKYDGYSFVSYKHDLDDTTSLYDNTLSVLYEDRAGVLWIGSYLGLERFDRGSETFVHYSPNPSDTGDNKSNQVWAICEDRSGVLWIGSGNGVHKFNRVTKEFVSLRHDTTDPGSISDNHVAAIYEDKEGSLWFGTGAGLDKLDSKTGRFEHYASHYWINSLCRDENGTLWLGTNEGLLEFNTEASTFSVHRLNPNKSYAQGSTGPLSLRTKEEIVDFDTKTGTLYDYTLNKNKLQDRINAICQDVITGSLWIGSRNGLFSFDRESRTSICYSRDRIPAVCSERSGTLWVGANVDIKKLNRTKQPFTRYPTKDAIYVVCTWSDGKLWMYTPNWWKQYDTRKGQFVPYSFGKGYLFYVWNLGTDISVRTEGGGVYIQDSLGNVTFSLDSSWKVHLDSACFGWKTKRGYWLGLTSGDLVLLEPKTNRVLRIRNFKQRIYWMYEDSFGLLWIATYMGPLFCYDQVKNSTLEFVSDIKDASSISGRQISHIYEDRKRRLWFATNSGLNRYERSTNSFVHFTERNGLPGNDVRGILEDDHGFLWLNTGEGISKFDPETNQFKNYDASYGVEPAAYEFYGAGCRTRSGDMYFGGAKGFTRFHPDSIKDNPFIPPIVVTSFRKFDKAYPFSNEIRLPHDENFISFEFAALSFMSAERNQYAYKMERLDKDWVYSGTRRFASYPALEPGEYVFRVKGSNNDGVWNEAGTSIAIVIAPPWWKSTWAYVLYSIILLSTVYLTWKIQVKRIRMAHEYEMSKFEAEKLHEVDEMKSRFFANISHEFRTPLTLILGPVKQAIGAIEDEKIRSDLRVVHKNANRLLGLVNQLLDLSKLESGSMTLRTIPQNIVPLLKALTLSFTSYAERKRIALSFNSVEDDILVYIDRDKIEKIITNILSNAFKFTPEGGSVIVSLRAQPRRGERSNLNTTEEIASSLRSAPRNDSGSDGFISIAVTDAGIGIPADRLEKIFDRFYQVDGSHTREQEGTGIGLSLTKELVELHKGHIEVESEEGKGSTFIVRIPLGKEHLKPEEICEPEEGEKKTSVGDREVSLVAEEMTYHEETKTEKPETMLGGRQVGLITETGPSAEQAGKPLLLIVEDNADVRNYIRDNVRKEYRVLEAIDGEDGWNKSIDQMPDVIVSDVMMPKMDGFALCEKLKKDERTSHIPVILLTAKASSQDKIEGYETGADDYIMKPFEQEEVKARIRNLIEQRKRIHEHFRRHGLLELEEKKITPVDQRFLQKAIDTIIQNISEPSFNVESFAENLAVSRYVLYKKTVSLTGESPVELIRRVRLNKAAELIQKKFGNLSEIALEVGFNSPAYFSDCFKKQFGVSPSQYQQESLNSQKP